MQYDQTIKSDAGKLRMDLIPPEGLEMLAEVLTYGANKYNDGTWREVVPERYEAALLRHYTAYKKDPHSVDEESGIPHVRHLLCNALFLACLEAEGSTGFNLSELAGAMYNTVANMSKALGKLCASGKVDNEKRNQV